MTINVALLRQMLDETNRRMDAAQVHDEPFVTQDIPASQRVGFYTPAQRREALNLIRNETQAIETTAVAVVTGDCQQVATATRRR